MSDGRRQDALTTPEDPLDPIVLVDEPSSEATERDGTQTRSQLRAASLRGVRAMLLSRVVIDLGGFAATIVLARLISPVEMGHAAAAIMVPMFAVILTFEGFGAVLVQKDVIDRADLSTSMALSFGLGVTLTVALAAFGLTVGQHVFAPESSILLATISPVFLFAGISTNSRCQLQRELKFRQIQFIELAGFIVLTAVSVGSAAAGLGGLSIVLGYLLGQAVELIGFVSCARPVRPRLHRSVAREIVGYGSYAALNGVGGVAQRAAPFFLLGALSDPRSTGLFYRAYQAGAENQGRLTNILSRVAFPVMSRAASADDVRHMRSRITAVNALVVLPLLAIFVVLAPTLIPWIYGDVWASAVVPAQLLALAGVALALTAGADVMALAMGFAREAMLYRLAGFILVVVAILLTSSSGLTVIAGAVAVAYVAHAVLAQTWLVGRVAGVRLTDFIAEITPAAVASIAAGGAGLGASRIVESWPALPLQVVVATVVLGVYVLVLRGISRSSYVTLRGFVGAVMPTGRARKRV